MDKHTPGPWHAKGVDNAFVVGGNPETLICAFDHNEAMETNKANARLIAAAPDLLAALREVVALDDGDIPALWAFAETFNRCRATIAKAEGKS